MIVLSEGARLTRPTVISLPVEYDDGTAGTAVILRGGIVPGISMTTSTRYAGGPKYTVFVMPFPNPGGIHTLRNVAVTPLKEWQPLIDAVEDLLPCKRGPRESGLGFHRDGTYECTVVADADALLSMEWARPDLALAPDVERRLAVVKDPHVCPRGCGFLVVAAAASLSDTAGFALVYPCIDEMLPTCREHAPQGPAATPDLPGLVRYDATFYTISRLPIWPGVMRVVTEQRACSPRLRAALRTTEVTGTLAANNAQTVITASYDAPRFVAKMTLQGVDVNTNVFVAGSGNFDPEIRFGREFSQDVLDKVFLYIAATAQAQAPRAGTGIATDATFAATAAATAATNCDDAPVSAYAPVSGSAVQGTAFNIAWQADAPQTDMMDVLSPPPRPQRLFSQSLWFPPCITQDRSTDGGPPTATVSADAAKPDAEPEAET